MRTVVKLWVGAGREAEISARLAEAGLTVVLAQTGRLYASIEAPGAACAPGELLAALRRRHGTAFGLDARPRLCAAVPPGSPFYHRLPPEGPPTTQLPKKRATRRARRPKERRKPPC